MKNNLVLLFATLIACLALLAACGSGSDSDETDLTVPLPTAQVNISLLPSATPEPDTPVSIHETATQAAQPAPQVQAWPTLDEEQYLLDSIDGSIDKIERRLNSINTELKP